MTRVNTTSRSLSEVMERLRQRGGPWNMAQDPGVDAVTVTAAWTESDDPFAMLLLLAALYPLSDELLCDALVARMSFFSPMQQEAEYEARSRPGMNYNGPDRFRFLHVAQRIRQALCELQRADRTRVEAQLSAAIRALIGDPYTLSRPR